MTLRRSALRSSLAAAGGSLRRGLGHGHHDFLDRLAVSRGRLERQADLERLAAAGHLQVHPERVEADDARVLHGEPHVVLGHGHDAVPVVRVHVRRDRGGERRDRVGSALEVRLAVHAAGAREAAHQPRADHRVHPVPREIPKVHPERVGVLRQVRLPGSFRVLGVGDLRHRAGQRDSGVRRAGEPGRGHGQGAVPVGGEVAGVPGHGRHGEDGASFVVRCEAHDGARGVRAAVLAAERADDGVATEVHQRAAFVSERELRRASLVLAERLNLGIDVHLGDRGVLTNVVRPRGDAEEARVRRAGGPRGRA
mmetsp:Transcript_4526/g.18077  ORF Transcript_4526/g.18077 Transcript_4526/m.18077 type:complete len:310 (-) Transcript_4526:98-1027(-)